jgi:hypothetical protein
VDVSRPTDLLPRLHEPYDRHYYAGIIHERWARHLLAKDVPVHISLGWIREAMREFEKASAISPAGNEDAILRWNACVRVFERAERHEAAPSQAKMTHEDEHGDEMPLR